MKSKSLVPSLIERAYELNGKTHVVGEKEWEAIARSGRSCWEIYANLPKLIERPISGAAKLMNARPGATDEGAFPVQTKCDGGARPSIYTQPAKTLHLRKRSSGVTVPACSTPKVQNMDVISFDRFYRIADKEIACQICRVAFHEELRGPNSRSIRESFVPMNWSAEELKNLRELGFKSVAPR